MHIRQATPADGAAILALQHLAYQSEALLYDDFTIAPLRQTLDELLRQFEDHVFLKALIKEESGVRSQESGVRSQESLGSAEDELLVGSVRARLCEGTCHIGRLIVLPAYQGQGIGTALLRRIEGCFPAAARYELFTGHKSERNLALYRSLGYQEVRREAAHAGLSIVTLVKARHSG